MESSMRNRSFNFGFCWDLIEFTQVSKVQSVKDGESDGKVVPKLILNGCNVYWATMENYIIRPFNLKLFDTSVTISPIIVTIDINILNNFRAMTKLMAYHSDNIDNKLVYVSRPRYLETALENPRKYWKFAINNVINIIRRKKVNNNKIKKQYEMSKLVEMLICKWL